MPIAPSASTGVKGSTSGTPGIDSGSGTNFASASLTVPDDGEMVTVVTAAWRTQGSSGNLINDVTLGGTSMTLGIRSSQQFYASYGYELCIWYALNVSSGAKTIALDFVNEDDSTRCNWHGDSWPGIVTANAVDKSDSAVIEADATSISVPSGGVTASLAQASELVIAAATSRWNWAWEGVYGGGGGVPNDWELVAGLTEDNVNQVPFQTRYKETSTTGGVQAVFAKENTGVNIAVLMTFKIGTTNRRVKVLADTAINSATGITAYAWSGDPSNMLARKWTDLTAESSGGILYLPDPPAAWTTGSEVNVIAYQPSGDKKTTGFVVGKVEEY